MAYILGVDIGTQGIKAVLLDESLKVSDRCYTEHEYIQPKQNWFEHDAEKTWWNGLKEIMRRILSDRSVSPREIIAIACSTITPCMLPVNADNEPLRNGILYGIDTRSKDEVAEMTQQLGEQTLLEIARMPLSTQSVGPKILWFKKNEPDIFAKTERIFTASNFITYRLTGNFILDYSQAALFAPLYDFKGSQWNKEICKELGFSLNLLPELRYCHEIAGTVTNKAAAETGLLQGTPVVVGTGDALAEFVSAGGFGHGQATLIYGTTGIIAITTDKAPPMKEVFILPHPILNNFYMSWGGTSTTGALTKWFRDNFGDIERIIQERTKVSAYTLLGEQAEDVSPGSEGLIVLPYFSGERTPINDPLARGVIIGLTVYHKRAHLYRALLEGSAYSFQHHFEVFEGYGFEISKVIACGGGAWVQIVSDVSGHDQLIPEIPLGAEIGSAYLAAKAIGIINDVGSFTANISTKNMRTVRFDAASHKRYKEYYKIYRRLYECTKNEMHSLAIEAERTGL
jgi:xylulokinase